MESWFCVFCQNNRLAKHNLELAMKNAKLSYNLLDMETEKKRLLMELGTLKQSRLDDLKNEIVVIRQEVSLFMHFVCLSS